MTAASALWTYTDTSHVIQTTDDNANAGMVIQDTMLRPTSYVDARGNVRDYTYDATGNIVTVTQTEVSDLGNPSLTFITQKEYDNVDRVVRITDPLGHVDEYSYDSRNNRVQHVDHRDHFVDFVAL